MKQFINDRGTVVSEAIDGIICTPEGRLGRLDGYPHIKVVVRTDWDKSRVSLISGGGSGHEPSHAGFVGEGMLTAAICGEIFSSPSVDAVLAGILAVTGKPGCLLIVKNYTGDRLNFGLAAERARALGYKVRMVVVGDDVALPSLPQPRGVAGTLFIHKIAGAMARAGADLDEIADAAERIAGQVVTLGMSLDTCTLPGLPKEERIGLDMAELGLGIHGEPGVEQVPYSTAKEAMNLLIDRLEPHAGPGSLVALINNLGGCTELEMSILTSTLMKSSLGGRIKELIGPSALMTSLDMKGFSVSLFSASGEDLTALRSSVIPTSWPGLKKAEKAEIIDIPEGLRPAKPVPSNNEKTKNLIVKCCRILSELEAELNSLDAKSGDGDTGSTLATAAKSLSSRLDQLPLADPPQLLRSIGQELSETMGGSSGVLMAIFFAASGDSLSGGGDITKALKNGLERIKQVGGAKPGDRTLIDALEPALEVLGQGLEDAAIAARKGADATAKITRAKAGRASYVSEENLAGYNDPGAEAVARLLEGLVPD
ncbi:MAG: DAK2 domain-containing protein [Rhodobacteraceae bacterium]|nr:dihydroxyacetone kinase subunit DhaK [Paracoccaceae bacterium]MXZ50182.1 DAK2 domain-containing protein [Paracoccaceae bacterium]MYF45526.1 DAK2 domain-containing protein [Paracoccaceae bacterium]MYI91225.1 DAK2 domain-containing protein [Paracoccaceae bacterium]